MGKLIPKSGKFKVAKEKTFKGGGTLTTLTNKNGDTLQYFVSNGYLYFVGVTARRIKLNNANPRSIIARAYNIQI